MGSGTTITYAALEEAAGKIRQAQGALEEVTSSIATAVSALEGGWIGESHNAFVEVWEESRPALERLAEAVGNFAPELENVVVRQTETETKNTSAIRGLAFN